MHASSKRPLMPNTLRCCTTIASPAAEPEPHHPRPVFPRRSPSSFHSSHAPFFFFFSLIHARFVTLEVTGPLPPPSEIRSRGGASRIPLRLSLMTNYNHTALPPNCRNCTECPNGSEAHPFRAMACALAQVITSQSTFTNSRHAKLVLYEINVVLSVLACLVDPPPIGGPLKLVS